MLENSFNKQKIFLLSIFILGNTVIVFPKGVGIETAVYSLLFALIPTLFSAIFINKIFFLDLKLNRFLKFIILVFCLVVFILGARDYISFVDNVRLPKTPRIFIAFIFILLSFTLGLLKRKVIYLFSLFSFFIISGIFIIVFLASIKEFNFNALNLKTFDFKAIIRQSLTFFIHSFGQIIIPILLFKKEKVEFKKSIFWFGILCGFVLILIYVLNIMLVLGSRTATAVDYPYSTLTSLLSFGRNFSRLDGFTYYIYFFSSLIKCAVTINLSKKLINNKTAKYFLAALLLVLCNLNSLDKFLKTDIFNLLLLVFELMLPIVIYVGLKVKSLRK